METSEPQSVAEVREAAYDAIFYNWTDGRALLAVFEAAVRADERNQMVRVAVAMGEPIQVTEREVQGARDEALRAVATKVLYGDRDKDYCWSCGERWWVSMEMGACRLHPLHAALATSAAPTQETPK